MSSFSFKMDEKDILTKKVEGFNTLCKYDITLSNYVLGLTITQNKI